jgi:hypothetical protein
MSLVSFQDAWVKLYESDAYISNAPLKTPTATVIFILRDEFKSPISLQMKSGCQWLEMLLAALTTTDLPSEFSVERGINITFPEKNAVFSKAQIIYDNAV